MAREGLAIFLGGVAEGTGEVTDETTGKVTALVTGEVTGASARHGGFFGREARATVTSHASLFRVAEACSRRPISPT